MQMPPPGLVEEREKAFSRHLGQALDVAVHEMQQSSGKMHAMAFKSPSLETACLTVDQLADALKNAEARLDTFVVALEGLSITDLLIGMLAVNVVSIVQKAHRDLVDANEAVYRQQEEYNNVTRLRRTQVGIERSVFAAFFTRPEQLQKLATEAGRMPGTTGRQGSETMRKPLNTQRTTKPKVSPPKTGRKVRTGF